MVPELWKTVPAVTKHFFEGQRLVYPRELLGGWREAGFLPLETPWGSLLCQVLCPYSFAAEDLREITVGHRNRSLVSSLSGILDVP